MAATRNSSSCGSKAVCGTLGEWPGRIPVEILIDTGAGEGNYISMAFWRSIQSWGGSAGQRKLNRRGSGSLQAANPVGSKVPGMEMVGTTVLPVVLPPEDRARNIAVRVVRLLPYAFILGASFFRTNSSVISLGEGKGFQVSPGSPWVPSS